MITRNQYIEQRLEYLNYVLEQIKPVPMKFNEWADRTVESLNKIHSNIHIKLNSLKEIVKGNN